MGHVRTNQAVDFQHRQETEAIQIWRVEKDRHTAVVGHLNSKSDLIPPRWTSYPLVDGGLTLYVVYNRTVHAMDLVTQSLMNTFQAEECLSAKMPEADLFEHFVNFCVVSNEYGEEFDVEEIHTGGGDDLGIDGLAVIVNGALVEDSEEVDDLATLNKYLEVEFIFCQAKPSRGGTSPAPISPVFSSV